MKHQLLIGIVMLLALSSCNTFYYFPDRVPVTGFTKKGEAMANASFKPGVYGSTWSADAAWSPASHLYVSGSFVRQMATLSSSWTPILSFSGYRSQISAGFYTAMGASWNLESAVTYGRGLQYRVEVLGNVQFGSNEPPKTLAEKTSVSDYDRYATHTTVVYSCSKYCTLAFGLQCVVQNGYNFVKYTYQVPNITSVWDVEPYIQLNLGRTVYFHSQLGFSTFRITSTGSDPRPFFATGIGYHYFGRKKKVIQNPM